MKWPDFVEEDHGDVEFIKLRRVRGGEYTITLDSKTWASRHKTACALNALGLSLQRVAFEIASSDALTDDKDEW